MTKKIDQTGIYASATNGQLYIGSTGAVPVLATITAGTNVTVTNGAGSISIAASGSGSAAVAQVNFNDSQVIQTQTNVTSITNNATGDNTVNFTAAVYSAHFVGLLACGDASSATTYSFTGPITSAPTTTAFRMLTFAYSTGNSTNVAFNSFAAF